MGQTKKIAGSNEYNPVSAKIRSGEGVTSCP